MFPTLVQVLLPAGIRGLIVACLLAALMSSLASLFNSSASLFTVDIYEKLRPGQSPKHLLNVGRIATAVVVVLGMVWIPVMQQISGGGLYQYLQSVQGYLAPPITAVFLLGLFWKRINAAGATWGLAGGFVLGMIKLTLQTFFGSGEGKIHDPAFLAADRRLQLLYATGVLLLVSAVDHGRRLARDAAAAGGEDPRAHLRLDPPRRRRGDQGELGSRQQGHAGDHPSLRRLDVPLLQLLAELSLGPGGRRPGGGRLLAGRRPQMTSRRIALLGAALGLADAVVRGAETPPEARPDPYAARPRVVVMTDIGNEPDDQMSLVRFLLYSNQWDVEGLVATTSTWLKNGVRPDVVHSVLDAYEKVQPNLARHASGFPTAAALRALVAPGQEAYGMASVGEGKVSPGAELPPGRSREGRSADRSGSWPGAGPNTLAQALLAARAARPPAEIEALVAKLRVYAISDQDDAGPWLRREFPELRYVAMPSTQDGEEYSLATWTGISGDRFYRNCDGADFTTFTGQWVDANVRAKGPLGALYPRPCCIHEGDTPSFLWLIDNGLASAMSPAFGGWGGRYVWRRPRGEPRAFWTQGGDSFPGNDSSRDTVVGVDGVAHTSDQATIWRWRRAFQNDLAARMDWTVKGPGEANHNPKVVVNGRTGTEPLFVDTVGRRPRRPRRRGHGRPRRRHAAVLVVLLPRGGHRHPRTTGARRAAASRLRPRRAAGAAPASRSRAARPRARPSCRRRPGSPTCSSPSRTTGRPPSPPTAAWCFTALLVLQLVEQGRLRLEDPLEEAPAGRRGGDAMTIHHLLTHTAAMPDFMSFEEAAKLPREYAPGSASTTATSATAPSGRSSRRSPGRPTRRVTPAR